ncbi:serine/threonine-protein kinase [Nonomuraea sp. NPDC049421]|uniref:serine/threonine-protein kinase n=1 Tax=Nonomuraea sp. NPDC049421 TaxID=3155275 RepID=UPI0034280EEF
MSSQLTPNTLTPLRQTLSIVWALVPLLSFGIGTIFVIGSAAARLARQKLWLAASGYLGYFILVMILAPGVNPPPEDRLRDTIAMWLWVLGMCVGGTVHAFFLRKEVFLPKVKSPETTGSAPASDPWATATRTRSSVGLGRVGSYTLLEKISQGGQGVVYLGRAPDGRQVAVKVERFHGGDRERLLFMREVDAARRIPPFSTAPILDMGIEGDTAFIVSEYVPGRSLQQRVRDDGPLDGGGLIRLAIATSAALKAIHAAGVVHRDFKPANVLLGPDGPRVIDFGIAKALDHITITSGALKGTPPYMSPEQVSGGRISFPSDVFSWASSMYFAATGRLAFGGSTDAQIYQAILHHRPGLHGLPQPLGALMTACFDQDPRKRPTAEHLLMSLPT